MHYALILFSFIFCPQINRHSYGCSILKKKKKNFSLSIIQHFVLKIVSTKFAFLWKEVQSNIFFLAQKYHFGLYILVSLSIWFPHFDSNQFGPYLFQLAVNLIPIVNSLTKNVYVVNEIHNWHSWSLCEK